MSFTIWVWVTRSPFPPSMRGHRLVADDSVDIRRVSNQLLGTSPEMIRHYIELRGIGVIDVRQLFGMRAIKVESQIDLVVQLEQWDNNKFYDRLGIEDHYTEILDLQVPCVTIPVRPGRNLASIVEVAAMTQEGETEGYTAADHIAALFKHSVPKLFDLCLANSSPIPKGVAARYAEEGAERICCDRERCKELGVEIINRPIATVENGFVRHEPGHLARELILLHAERSVRIAGDKFTFDKDFYRVEDSKR